MSENSNHISIREFARRVGCSDTSIRKAIKAQKIVKGIVHVADGRDKLDYDIAFKEWSAAYDPSYPSNANIRSKMMNAPAPPADAPADTPASADTSSMAAAKRAQAILKAKILEIELKEKQKRLIDKQQAYMAMFEAGKEVKASIMSVPDRAIDAIFSAKTRNEAHTILTKALIDALDVLADINAKPILD